MMIHPEYTLPNIFLEIEGKWQISLHIFAMRLEPHINHQIAQHGPK